MTTRRLAVERARWEHFAHEADVGVRGVGASREEAFAQAALALTGIACDPARVRPAEEVRVECPAADGELLLVAWLNAVIAEMSARRMLFSRFEPRIEGGRLTAVLAGERVEPARHAPAAEPKGATLTALSVREADGAWTAECVVDV